MIGLFVLSDIAKAPSCNFFLWGAASLGLGIFLWFRDPIQPGPPANRFRLLRHEKKQAKKK